MTEEIVIKVEHMSKVYPLYEKKTDRLKETFFGKKLHKEYFALKNITFTIFKGENIGLLGVNVPRYEQETGSLFRHLQLWRELYT